MGLVHAGVEQALARGELHDCPRFTTEMFCKVDDQLGEIPKYPQALLYASEVVTIGMLYAPQGSERKSVLSLVAGELLGHVPKPSTPNRGFPLYVLSSRLDRILDGIAIDVGSD